MANPRQNPSATAGAINAASRRQWAETVAAKLQTTLGAVKVTVPVPDHVDPQFPIEPPGDGGN